MEFTTLGRTELPVSRIGLGCGGHSRLGTRKGKSEADAEHLVREALDLGINFIDTAESYGTEEIVGRALVGLPRESVVISTKAGVDWQERRCTPAEYRARVEASLSRLQSNYVDVFHVHGVTEDEYPHAIEVALPVLKQLQAQGKIRFIGITEAFGVDPGHRVLSKAVHDGYWDVMMVGFNLLNQSARDRVLPWTQANRIGTLAMFAVRRALTDPALARSVILGLAESGAINSDEFDLDDPLRFLVAEGIASSLSEAAYRFCRDEPGLDIILSGTGNVDHLRENVTAMNRPPLPIETTERLRHLFRGVDTVAGN